MSSDAETLPGAIASLLPWYVTGALDPQDARRVAAAAVSDPDLADDLIAARAEQAEVAAMGEALGRPSQRPLLALFAAIDAEAEPVATNVTRLDFARPPFAFEAAAAVGLTRKKNQPTALNAGVG